MNTRSIMKKGCIFLMSMMFVFILGSCNSDDPELVNYIPAAPPLESSVLLAFKDLQGEETAPWFATQVTVTWAPAANARAYFFSLFDVTDGGRTLIGTADNVVVTENPPTISRPLVRERMYRVELRSQGDEAARADDSSETTVVEFSTQNPGTIIIPPGNLTTYFTNNPVFQVALTLSQPYELVAGGEYTMSGDIFIGGKAVTIKGADPANRAKIAMSGGSFIIGGGAFEMENINIDCTLTPAAPPVAPPASTPVAAPIFRMHTSLPRGAVLSAGGFCVANGAFVLKNVDMKAIKASLFSGGGSNGLKFAIPQFVIDNCIINFEMPLASTAGMTPNTNGSFLADNAYWAELVPHFAFNNTVVREIHFNTSTFYTESPTQRVPQANSDYSNRMFIRTAGTANATAVPEWVDEKGISGWFKVIKCTFFQLCMSEHIYSGTSLRPGDATIYEFTHNVFHDSFAGSIHRYTGGVTGVTVNAENVANYRFTLNAYSFRWPGAIPNNGGGVIFEAGARGAMTLDYTARNETIFGVPANTPVADINIDAADPQLQLTNAGTFPPVFTMKAEAKAAEIGDPRWLK